MSGSIAKSRMRRRRPGAVAVWLGFAWLTSCGGSTLGGEGDDLPPPQSGGQSGNEGSGIVNPCLSQVLPALRAHVDALSAGCVAIVVDEAVNQSAEADYHFGERLYGRYAGYFWTQELANGEEVLAIYYPGPEGTDDDSLRLAPLSGERVSFEWEGSIVEHSLDELLSPTCPDLFPRHPADEEPVESDPDGTTPSGGPVDCSGIE